MDKQPIKQSPELTPEEEARYRQEADELFRPIEERAAAGLQPSGSATERSQDATTVTPDELVEQALAPLQEVEGDSDPVGEMDDQSDETTRATGERRFVLQRPVQLHTDGSVPAERILTPDELNGILIEPKRTEKIRINPDGNDLGPTDEGDRAPKPAGLETTTANVDPGLTKRVLEGLRRTVQEKKAVTADRADLLSEGNFGPDVHVDDEKESVGQTTSSLDAVRDPDDAISQSTPTYQSGNSGGLRATTPESDYLNF